MYTAFLTVCTYLGLQSAQGMQGRPLLDGSDSVAIRGVSMRLKAMVVNEIVHHEGESKEGQAKMYYGDVTLGTPGQKFIVVYDTGSANLIVPGSSCIDEACMAHNQYDRSQSRTSKGIKCKDEEDSGSVTIKFGTGLVVGDCIEDSVCLDGACATAAFLSSTEESTNPFLGFSFDGVLGLSLPEMAQGPQFSIFSQLQGAFDNKVFSVFLAPDETEASEVTFGDIKEDHMGSELFWVNVEPGSGYWQVTADDIVFDSEPQNLCSGEGCKVAVDTGTTMLAGPSSVISSLREALAVEEDCSNYDELPKLGFIVSSKVLSLRPQEYVRRSESDTCSLALMALDIPPPRGPLFIFGTPFLQRYFTAYDLLNNRVGFAVAKHEGSEPDALISINVTQHVYQMPANPTEFIQD